MKKALILISLITSFTVSANKVSESKYAIAALDLAPNMIFLSQGGSSKWPNATIISLYGEKKSRGVRAICDFAFEDGENGEPIFIEMDCKAGTRVGHVLNF